MASAGAGSSSRFAVTCGLMRQYMREQQQQGGGGGAPRSLALSLGLPSPDETDARRNMQLFPAGASSMPRNESIILFLVLLLLFVAAFDVSYVRRSGLGDLICVSSRPAETQTRAPLTMFYDGPVVVFEDFPADKAMKLMQLAGSVSSSSSPEAPADKSAVLQSVPAGPEPGALSDLPLARKASLQRFLHKRKHRQVATTDHPYQKPMASPAKDHQHPSTWLGL